jgi:hypothetical protein
MALSKSTLKELNNELTRLLRERRDIDLRVHSIQAIMSRPNALRLAANSTKPYAEPANRNSPLIKSGRVKRGGLRRCVLEILRSSAPLNSAGIASQLADRGVRVGGRVGLKKRVSHELSRLRRVGLLVRRATGEYEITASGTGSTSEPVHPPR